MPNNAAFSPKRHLAPFHYRLPPSCPCCAYDPVVIEDPKSSSEFDPTLPWTTYRDPSQSNIWANSQSPGHSPINERLRARDTAADPGEENFSTWDGTFVETPGVQSFNGPQPANAGPQREMGYWMVIL